MTFKRAVQLMPACLASVVDSVGQHKTVSDLWFMAQTELDLDDEGDIELSKQDRLAIENYISQIGRCDKENV